MNIEQVIRDYIEPLVHMSLASVSDNKPWVFEVHFAYDDDLNLYFRSLSSRQHSGHIAKNPYVAGNIVRQHALGEPGVCVSFEGTAKLLEPGEEQNKAFECIKKRLGTSDQILEEANRDDGHKFYKISVENYYLFGAFDGQPSQKYKIEWNNNKK